MELVAPCRFSFSVSGARCASGLSSRFEDIADALPAFLKIETTSGSLTKLMGRADNSAASVG
jgi:hypothetical protein